MNYQRAYKSNYSTINTIILDECNTIDELFVRNGAQIKELVNIRDGLAEDFILNCDDITDIINYLCTS